MLHLGKVEKVVLCLFLISSLMLTKFPAFASMYINHVTREINKRSWLWYARGMDRVAGEHFAVLYPSGQAAAAELVLDAAEHFYPSIAGDFGSEVKGLTPVVVYGDMTRLNRSFGWPANAGTMGVYWAGTIRVLAPDAWIAEEDAASVREVFISSGPMAHEITHLFVDELTRGNCPRWFNEGVAQFEEYCLTGFKFQEPEFFNPDTAYSLNELDEFDELSDQDKAYHQAFSMVYFLVEKYEWGQVLQVLHGLGRALRFDEAVKNALGLSIDEVDRAWRQYLQERNNAGE